MGGKIKIFGILVILMLAIPLTATARTLKTDVVTVEKNLKLDNFEKQIDEVFDGIKVEFPTIYNDLYSQAQLALSKATYVNENGIKMVNYEIFEKELNSQPAGFGRNVIRAYDLACTYADKGSYFTLKSTNVGVHWKNEIYHYIFKSKSYGIKIYTDWYYKDGNTNNIPLPKGDVALYAKRVYIQGWPGNHVSIYPDPNNGLGGLTSVVLAIGSLTEPNCFYNSASSFFGKISMSFSTIIKNNANSNCQELIKLLSST